MAYKTPGSLDFSLGQMGRFVCYCGHCNQKVVLLPDQFVKLKKDLRTSKDTLSKYSLRLWTKKVLTRVVEGL